MTIELASALIEKRFANDCRGRRCLNVLETPQGAACQALLTAQIVVEDGIPSRKALDIALEMHSAPSDCHQVVK